MNDVIIGSLTVNVDNRGSFTELWRADKIPLEIKQINRSISRASVLRGMHFHARQSDIWYLTRGKAFVNLYDLRSASGRNGERSAALGFTLLPNNYVVIPPFVAHGFLALEEMELIYGVTNTYDKSDELSFSYHDVEWPYLETPFLVSERDEAAPRLAQLAL